MLKMRRKDKVRIKKLKVKTNYVREHKFALIFSEKKYSRSSEKNEGRVIECAFKQSKN